MEEEGEGGRGEGGVRQRQLLRLHLRTREYLQGYLAHKKQPHLLGPPWGPRHRPTVGS